MVGLISSTSIMYSTQTAMSSSLWQVGVISQGVNHIILLHYEEQKWCLPFGFVLGNDLLSYWLDHLLGHLGLPIILRIYKKDEARAPGHWGQTAPSTGMMFHGNSLRFLPSVSTSTGPCRSSMMRVGMPWILYSQLRHNTGPPQCRGQQARASH